MIDYKKNIKKIKKRYKRGSAQPSNTWKKRKLSKWVPQMYRQLPMMIPPQMIIHLLIIIRVMPMDTNGFQYGITTFQQILNLVQVMTNYCIEKN